MSNMRWDARFALRALSRSAGACAFALLSTAAVAGQCPPGKAGMGMHGESDGIGSAVTGTVLGKRAFGGQTQGPDKRGVRVRRVVVQPRQGVVWHAGTTRPSLIYVAQGEIREYSSDCAVPIIHRAGDLAQHSNAATNWWKNQSHRTVVIVAIEFVDDTDARRM